MSGKRFSSVWAREPRPGRSPGLSRDEIVRTAVELLDAEGLEGLSMRKLGAKLNVGATSLYWYVAHKDELLELVYDRIWGEMAIPDPGEAGWRHTASAFARSMRQVMLRHPWSSELIGRMPAVGPNAVSVTQTLRSAFRSAGFEGLEVDYAGGVLTAFVFGMTIPEVAWAKAMSDGGLDERSLHDALERSAAGHPDLLERVREINTDDGQAIRERSFTFGLAAVLDGLEARMTT